MGDYMAVVESSHESGKSKDLESPIHSNFLTKQFNMVLAQSIFNRSHIFPCPKLQPADFFSGEIRGPAFCVWQYSANDPIFNAGYQSTTWEEDSKNCLKADNSGTETRITDLLAFDLF